MTDESAIRPIFIVSAMRSGSTMLRLILDAHPNIAIGPETGFMRSVDLIKNVEGITNGDGWYRGWGISDERMDELIAEFYGKVFSEYARAQGKSRWGEKTPLHVYHMSEMRRLYPGAQFLGILRHPGAVVESHIRWGYEYQRSVGAWKSSTERILKLAYHQPEAMHVVRYEDLLLTPREAIGAVLGWLGEEWSDDVLQHGSVHRSRNAPRKVEGGTDSYREIDASAIDAWKDRLPGEQVAGLGKIGPPMKAAGYAAETSEPVGPIRPELIIPLRQRIRAKDGD